MRSSAHTCMCVRERGEKRACARLSVDGRADGGGRARRDAATASTWWPASTGSPSSTSGRSACSRPAHARMRAHTHARTHTRARARAHTHTHGAHSWNERTRISARERMGGVSPWAAPLPSHHHHIANNNNTHQHARSRTHALTRARAAFPAHVCIPHARTPGRRVYPRRPCPRRGGREG